MSALERILRRRVALAKQHVFALQGYADALGDPELKRQLAHAREGLEATDRRLLGMRSGGDKGTGIDWRAE